MDKNMDSSKRKKFLIASICVLLLLAALIYLLFFRTKPAGPAPTEGPAAPVASVAVVPTATPSPTPTQTPAASDASVPAPTPAAPALPAPPTATPGYARVSGHEAHFGGMFTCTEAAVCAECGASYGMPPGHSFAAWYTVDIAPTCTEAGSRSRHCTRCGARTDIKMMPRTGHSYAAAWTSDAAGHWHETVCEHIGRSGYAPHFGGAATCTEAAVCAECGAPYGRPLGHDFATEYTVDLAATCAAEGSQSRHCPRCDAKTDVTAIPALGHSFSEAWMSGGDGHWHICTREGCVQESTHEAHAGGTASCENAALCSVCSASYGSALGHSFAEAWTSNEHEHWHFCTREGCEEESAHETHTGGAASCEHAALCSICSEPYGHALGHSFPAAWMSDETEHWHVCSREGCEEAGGKAGHLGGEATCTEGAVCVLCGEPYGEPLGHDFATDFTIDLAATCTTAGSQSRHCTLCGAKTDVTAIPALGHSWSPWSTTNPATCVATGTQEHVCENDSTHSEVQTLPIDHDAHKWDWNWSKGTVTEPSTCNQDGEMTFTCGNGCGHQESVPLPRSAHTHAVNFAQPANGTITVTYEDNTPVISGTAVPCGSVLSVTAAPDYGYHLVAVKVNGKNMAETFTVQGGAATVEAAMALNTYTINTGANGTGAEIQIEPKGPVTVGHGGDKAFTITTGQGFRVKEVTVDGISQGAITSYTFTNVQSAHMIEATFMRVHEITASANPGTDGTISPSGVTEADHEGAITYTITPNAGCRIKDVLVDGVSVKAQVGADGTYTFTNVTEPHTISAVFIKQHTITLAVVGGKWGTVTGGTVTVDEGESVTFTATPNPGCVASIQVDGVTVIGTSESKLIHMFTSVSASHTITVSFASNRHTITSSAGSHGTILPSGMTEVPGGADQTFTFKPETGYRVRAVKIDGESEAPWTASTYKFEKVDQDHQIQVYFEPITYTVTAGAGTGGSVSPPGTTNLTYGQTQTVTITPSAGYAVTDVLVDGVSVGAVTSYTFSDNQSHTIHASFHRVYTITASAEAGGAISPPTGTFAAGTSPEYTITPDAGYRVKEVIVDGISQGAITNHIFTNVQEDHAITAKFIGVYEITASAGTGGTISSPGVTEVNQGGEITYTITPNAGYKLKDVLVDGASVGTDTTYTFTNVAGAHTISATFEQITYLITALPCVHGEIGPRVYTYVPYGGSQTYVIWPEAGYMIKDVQVDGTSIGAVTKYTFANVTEPHSITATFGFAISVHAGAGGVISPESKVVEPGASETFTITPDTGYLIKKVTVDGASVGPVFSYSFTNVDKAHSIMAEFEKRAYTITVATTHLGKVGVPLGMAQVGDTINLAIAPNSGCRLKAGSLKVNGEAITTWLDERTASFTMPAANVTITAEFEQIPYTVTTDAVENGSISVLTEGDVFYHPNTIVVSLVPESLKYRLVPESVKVTGESGKPYPVSVSADRTTASFKVPEENVTVTAEFELVILTVTPSRMTFTLWRTVEPTFTVIGVKKEQLESVSLSPPYPPGLNFNSGWYFIQDTDQGVLFIFRQSQFDRMFPLAPPYVYTFTFEFSTGVGYAEVQVLEPDSPPHNRGN